MVACGLGGGKAERAAGAGLRRRAAGASAPSLSSTWLFSGVLSVRFILPSPHTGSQFLLIEIPPTGPEPSLAGRAIKQHPTSQGWPSVGGQGLQNTP